MNTKIKIKKNQSRTVMFSLLFVSLLSLNFDIFYRCLFCSIPTFSWTLQHWYENVVITSAEKIKQKKKTVKPFA